MFKLMDCNCIRILGTQARAKSRCGCNRYVLACQTGCIICRESFSGDFSGGYDELLLVMTNLKRRRQASVCLQLTCCVRRHLVRTSSLASNALGWQSVRASWDGFAGPVWRRARASSVSASRPNSPPLSALGGTAGNHTGWFEV